MSEAITGARRAAYEVVRRVFEHEAWADRAFPGAAQRHRLDDRERSQAQRLAYGAVQRRGTSDHLIGVLAARPVERLDPPVVAALRLGLYELLYSEGSPDYAAVDQAVELAKAGVAAERSAGRGRADAAAGLVNAVLRRASRERGALLAGVDDSTPEGAAVLHSYPDWLVRMWWQELGPEGARSLMAAMNEPAETALRVNTLRIDPATVLEIERAEEGVQRPVSPEPLAPPESLVARGPLGEGLRRRIGAGELVPQSRASQAAIAVLDPRPGERVLDLCAGPGIKTTAIAARLQNRGEIVAVEIDPGRARQLRELCGRLGATCVRVIEADAASVDMSEGYDRILVDPPCSDLGTLASRPDARWRKSPALIERLAETQERILARATGALGRGGTLVYSTCTISARENERVAGGLAADESRLRWEELGRRHPGFASAADPRFLQTRPDRHRTAGFFIARLRSAEPEAGGR